MARSEIVRAPWTLEIVRSLRLRQADTTLHPYTCKVHSNLSLVPTFMGWICPRNTCDYEQDWAHLADTRRKS